MTPYYADDLVTLYHGDCRELLPDVAGDASVVVTDPPYGMGYQHGARRGGHRYGMDELSIVGDFEPFDPGSILGLGLGTVLFGANHFAHRLPPSRGWLVWDKRDGTASNDQSDCELAWTNVLTTARLFSARWSGAHRTGREQQDGRSHPNQKPVALAGSGSTLVAAKEMGRRSIGIEVEERWCEDAARRCSQEVLGLELPA